MTKDEIEDIVADEIKKFVNNSLDKEMKKLLHNNNSNSRAELISTIKGSIENLYKTIWQKKEMVLSGIK